MPQVRRSALVLLVLLGLGCAAGVVGCDGPAPPAGDGGHDAGADAGTGRACTADAECDDGLFCNGVETCVASACAAGTPPDCDDGIACTRDLCSETRAECRNVVPDADGDGVGDAACVDGAGTPLGRDCDDSDPLRFPGNEELCDEAGHDEDCDPTTYGRVDFDGDRYDAARCCNTDSMGAMHCGTDCDDVRTSVSPMATEACDGFDNDCDGNTDEGVGATLYADADRDGHGNPAAPVSGCAGTTGTATLNDDCDDTNPARHPAQLEFCDSVDNDCDTRIDEDARPVPWYPDADGDGFGSSSATATMSCTPLAGHSLRNTDCDDTMAGRSPAAPEACNGLDDDCNGRADFRIGVNDFEDDDGDGIVDIACGAPLGLDCDDSDPVTGGGEVERCDGRDNDCDTRIDEDATTAVWYRDADGDSYGSATGGAMLSCSPIAGYVRRAGDCDDANAMRSPDAAETCNARDDDCDGASDEAPASAPCMFANAVGACIGGACGIARCSAGFADCDGVATNGCERPLGTIDDCAACGDACRGASATMACTAGRCVISACMPGASDCNLDPRDGCEVRTADDDRNCGTCGRRCSAPNARTSCVGGMCAVDACDPLWGNCNADPADGCERRLDTMSDCGGCGATCSGAGRMCDAGVCRLAGCTGSLADCNGNTMDGCEVDTSIDPLNCGGCRIGCFAPGAVPACVGGRCEIASCMPGFADCNVSFADGCEVSLNDPNHCGMCGRRCSFANATARCAAGGVCQLDTCQVGWSDCDMSPATGCERNTSSDPMNCGSCGNRCMAPGAIPGCFGSMCGIAGCAGGRADCNGVVPDGCEVDVESDPMNCGGCGRVCGAAGVCQLGRCDDIVEVVTGVTHTCVRRARGGVACWGQNGNGELGRGTMGAPIPIPGPVTVIGRAVRLAAGAGHTCYVNDLGELYCWGDNGLGQLGDGSTTRRALPTRVLGIPPVIDVAAGANHTCARTSTALYCWGRNVEGQLGLGDTLSPRTTPQLVGTAPSGITAISAGALFTCVMDVGGAISCTGSNAFGQLGDGSTTPRSDYGTPQAFVPNGIAMSSGGGHTCVVNTFGEAHCWGQNTSGQLGLGMTSTSVNSPAQSMAVLVDGVATPGDTTCFRSRAGSMLCVGNNAFGQMGDGASGGPRLALSRPTGDPTISALPRSGGAANHLCVVDTVGLLCWGRNDAGQGSGDTLSPLTTPRRVLGLP